MNTESSVVRRFIRNKNTGEYWGTKGSWTQSCSDALAFSNTIDLIDCCQQQDLLRDIQLLVKPCGEQATEVIVDLF